MEVRGEGRHHAVGTDSEHAAADVASTSRIAVGDNRLHRAVGKLLHTDVARPLDRHRDRVGGERRLRSHRNRQPGRQVGHEHAAGVDRWDRAGRGQGAEGGRRRDRGAVREVAVLIVGDVLEPAEGGRDRTLAVDTRRRRGRRCRDNGRDVVLRDRVVLRQAVADQQLATQPLNPAQTRLGRNATASRRAEVREGRVIGRGVDRVRRRQTHLRPVRHRRHRHAGLARALNVRARHEGVRVQEQNRVAVARQVLHRGGRAQARVAGEGCRGRRRLRVVRRVLPDEHPSQERLLVGRRHQKRRRLHVQHARLDRVEREVKTHEGAVGGNPVDHVLERVGGVGRRHEHRRLAVEIAVGIERDVVPVGQTRAGIGPVAAPSGRIEIVQHRIQIKENTRVSCRRIDPVNHARPIDRGLQGRVAEVRVRVRTRSPRDRVESVSEHAAGAGLNPDHIAAEGVQRGQLGHRRCGRRTEVRGHRRNGDGAQVGIGRRGRRRERRHGHRGRHHWGE